MGELKPVGSEKLNADAKMKRILELTYYQSPNDSKKSTTIVETTLTGVYGIVREKDGYYVKKGLNESSLDYIGGLFMKNKNKFQSYGDALKKAEFLVEQEKLQEATRYVLKSKTPKAEAPIPEPTNEVPPTDTAPEAAPTDELPTDDGSEMSPDELSGEEPAPEGEEDYLKVIQKLASKLQQKLTAYKEKLESKDIKAAIMQVLSGVDLQNQLDENDREEILDKFEPEEEVPGETSDETLPTDEVPSEETPAPAEDDLGEEDEDGMKKLEELIGTSFFDDEGDSIDPDDEGDDEFELGPEDYQAQKFAEKDLATEFPGEENDEKSDDEMLDDIWKDLKSSKGQKPTEADEQSGRPVEDDELPIPDEELDAKAEVPFPEAEKDEVKELDINELTDIVNTSVKETLSKYFNQ